MNVLRTFRGRAVPYLGSTYTRNINKKRELLEIIIIICISQLYRLLLQFTITT